MTGVQGVPSGQGTNDRPANAASLAHAFSEAERQAVYRAIRERRDMRHFSGGSVPDEQLQRLLQAAHQAPSVGLMQPWRFIRVRDAGLRGAIHALVEQERVLTAQALGEREDEFMKLKVQGVLDAAEVLVACMPPGREAHIFGRRTLPEMDLASVACAIQNLWLAARAEGLGLGWVSIFCPAQLAQCLHLPEGSRPVAILCLGPVVAFYDRPMLQAEQWASPAPLSAMLFEDRWGRFPPEADGSAAATVSPGMPAMTASDTPPTTPSSTTAPGKTSP
ncbi:MAG: 5,6-dimethylbenzimidazole synthase [Polaromonas sp.]|nr:5,6-dimethylbenzimidazole synthase [Polaromonas sp.]